MCAVGESDRHFRDLESLPPKFICQLNLEAVTVTFDFIEVKGLEPALAEGSSKRAAEKAAALTMLQRLGIVPAETHS